MKVLVFTTVFPNQKQPNFGIFVRERIARLAKLCDLKVLAPVPWCPPAGLVSGKYRRRVPSFENQQGLEVYHPRFALIPGVTKPLHGIYLYLSSIRQVISIQKSFDFDLIDAHFAYPDGFAAVLLGRLLRKPVSVTLRGTLNRLVHRPVEKELIRFTLNHATSVISVSAYLAELAHKLGLRHNRFEVIPNGVETSSFRILNKTEARKGLGIPATSKVIISVGALCERKGHHRILEALPQLVQKYPDLLYIIVGGRSAEGDWLEYLKHQAASLGLSAVVRLIGEIPHEEVTNYLNASDIFALATRYEGWPNVFFEAMACGLPVVTTDVCGNHEIVKDETLGLIAPFGNKRAMADALDRALSCHWDRHAIAAYAQSHTWENVAQHVYAQFCSVLAESTEWKNRPLAQALSVNAPMHSASRARGVE